MAVPYRAFSIRDYVANMRNVDVAKSRPFDGAYPLPPMEVKKFRYWSDELEKLKARGKEAKKRSIADIFAVAPHVEREDVGADYLDDEGEESDGGDPRVLALCDVKIKEKILEKRLKLSLPKKKERTHVDREDKPLNANFARIPKSSLRKGSEENASNLVPTPKKKRSKLKCLATESQKKSIETSKLTKQSKSEKDSMIRSQKLSKLENDQQNKSSDTGDSMGPEENTFPCVDNTKTQNLRAPSLCVNNHLVERGKNVVANEISDKDRNQQYESGKKKIDASLMAGNQVPPSTDDFPSYASSSRFFHLRNEDDNCDSSNDDMSRATTTSSIEFTDSHGRFPFSSPKGKAVNYDYSDLQHKSLSYWDSGEMLHSMVPFSDLKLQAVPCDVRYTDQGFCGLPLNSQGELLQFGSNECKGMFNPPMKPTSATPGYSTSLPLHNLDLSQFKDNIYGGSKEIELFKSPPIRNLVRETSRFPMFHEVPSNSHVYNMHNHKENNKRSGPVSQQTMRLMGKEFMIGKSNDDSQSSDDGNIWTDKEIIAVHHTASSLGLDTSSSKTPRFEQGWNLYHASKKSVENIIFDNKSQIHPLLTEKFPHFNPLTNRNHPSQLHPYFPSTPSKLFNVEKSHLQEPFVYRYGYDSARVNMSPNFADTKKQHTLPCPSRKSFEFPFLHPVCGDNMNSSSTLPSCLLSRKQHKETSATSYTSYFDVRDGFQPESSYAPRPASSFSNRQGSTSAPSHPLTPPNSRFMPTSVNLNNNQGYRIIPKVSTNNFDKGKVRRKRRADKLNLTRKKISNIDGFKRSSSVNEDHSRSIQSKVPLAATTKSGLISNLQRKLTPIFRF